MREWRKTHELITDRETIEVMAIDNCGYTKEEYDSEINADFEYDSAGRWTYLGEPFCGAVVKVAELEPVEGLRPELVDKSKFFETVCVMPNMTVLVAPTGESIDIRIRNGKLMIKVNTDSPDTPVSYTEEWERNKYQKNPQDKIFYHSISLSSSKRSS